MNKNYSTIEDAIKKNLSIKEVPKTSALINKFKDVKECGKSSIFMVL